jgi:UDP-N-acetylmuramate: L-alanyl-gamma-D-glutamyl-meso-diaminopimelate ligase
MVVYDDFAHHPTAMRTTVDGLRRNSTPRAAHRRILAVFEPRSNTMKLGTMKSQLPWALEHADGAFATPAAGLGRRRRAGAAGRARPAWPPASTPCGPGRRGGAARRPRAA